MVFPARLGTTMLNELVVMALIRALDKSLGKQYAPKSIKIGDELETSSAYDASKDAIVIRKEPKNDFDYCFMIAHEWRHCYQVKTKDPCLEGYRQRSEFKSADEYNMQKAEVDANAFAWYIVASLTGFKAKPLFQGLGEEPKKAIEARYGEMLAEQDKLKRKGGANMACKKKKGGKKRK